MKTLQSALWVALAMVATSCGKAKEAQQAVKDTATEVANSIQVQGRWLVTESEHGGVLDHLAENETMVLTFKDGKAAFAPTDSAKGELVFAALKECTKGPREYRAEKNDIVFPATTNPNCTEKRISVQQLNADTFKFPDPEDPDVTRVMKRIDEEQYLALVKASDRKI